MNSQLIFGADFGDQKQEEQRVVSVEWRRFVAENDGLNAGKDDWQIWRKGMRKTTRQGRGESGQHDEDEDQSSSSFM